MDMGRLLDIFRRRKTIRLDKNAGVEVLNKKRVIQDPRKRRMT